MEISTETKTFSCPICKKTFKFDNVEEYQPVLYPVCAIDFVTIKKNQILTLQYFELLDKRSNQ
jgi:hypothetical protein